jgi:hypothetical protein
MMMKLAFYQLVGDYSIPGDKWLAHPSFSILLKGKIYFTKEDVTIFKKNKSRQKAFEMELDIPRLRSSEWWPQYWRPPSTVTPHPRLLLLGFEFQTTSSSNSTNTCPVYKATIWCRVLLFPNAVEWCNSSKKKKTESGGVRKMSHPRHEHGELTSFLSLTRSRKEKCSIWLGVIVERIAVPKIAQ